MKSTTEQARDLTSAQLAALDTEKRKLVFAPYRNPDWQRSPHESDHVAPWRARDIPRACDRMAHLAVGEAFPKKEKAALQELENAFGKAFGELETVANPDVYQRQITALLKDDDARDRIAKLDALRVKIANCPVYLQEINARLHKIERDLLPAAESVTVAVARRVGTELRTLEDCQADSIYAFFGLTATTLRDVIYFPLRALMDSLLERLNRIRAAKPEDIGIGRGILERAGIIEFRAPYQGAT